MERDKAKPRGAGGRAKSNNKNIKKTISLIVFIVGLLTLVVGVVFLVLKLTAGPNVADAERLVDQGEWVLAEEREQCVEGGPVCEYSIVWSFTEIGKGTLTTNGHKNDYDFIWAIEDGKLKIETKWLYDLENEYQYKLESVDDVLTLTLESGEEITKMQPILQKKVD